MPIMVDNQFFDESREQSQIKARIVAKDFWAWANVILPSVRRTGGRIAYIDLFAGPGRYEDGTLSTPLLVLEKAIEDPNMRKMLVTVSFSRASRFICNFFWEYFLKSCASVWRSI